MDVAAAFSAVNESTWEHMKLLFFPMFLFSVVQLCCLGRTYPNFLAARGVSTLTGVLLIPVLFYTYTGVVGAHVMWADIAVFFLAVFGAFALDFRLLRRGRFTSLAAAAGAGDFMGPGVPLCVLHVPPAGAGTVAGSADRKLWRRRINRRAVPAGTARRCFRGFYTRTVDRAPDGGYNKTS